MTATTITPIECPSCLAPCFAPGDSAGERITCTGCGARLVTARTAGGVTAILLRAGRAKIRLADLRAGAAAALDRPADVVSLRVLMGVAFGLGDHAAETFALLLAAIGVFADGTDSPGEVLGLAVDILTKDRDQALGVPEAIDG